MCSLRQLSNVTYSDKSIGEFFEHYNVLVWLCKEESNYFRAGEIPGDLSPVEEEIEIARRAKGIKDLKAPREENRGFINQWMAILHN